MPNDDILPETPTVDWLLDTEAYANELRDLLKEVETKARDFSELLKANVINISWDRWEVIANSILAIRHIEDARMRYWKVIQYSWNWVSIYDKQLIRRLS